MTSDIGNRVVDGVLTVPVCPFDGGGIDEATTATIAEKIAGSGVDAIVPCGNTSEYFAMTPSEAERFAEVCIRATAGRIPVIVGVGGDVGSAVEQAQRAKRLGADAVMIHEPVAPYFSAQGLIEYFTTIAEGAEVAAFPYIRKDTLTAEDYELLLDCENIVGAKLATANLDLVAQLTETYADKVWICGSAELWAPFYRMAGARGFTSGLAGFQAELSLKLRDQLKSGEFDGAMTTWRAIRPFELLRTGVNTAYNVATIKEAMRLLGVDVGRPRLPATQLPEAMSHQLERILMGWGLLEGRAVAAT